VHKASDVEALDGLQRLFVGQNHRLQLFGDLDIGPELEVFLFQTFVEGENFCRCLFEIGPGLARESDDLGCHFAGVNSDQEGHKCYAKGQNPQAKEPRVFNDPARAEIVKGNQKS